MAWRPAVAVVPLVAAVTLPACGGTDGSSRPASQASTTPAGTAAPARPAAAHAAVAADGDWPTYHRDRRRTGAAPSGPALGSVRRVWATRLAGAVYAQPLIVGDKVVVAGENDVVSALRAGDGRPVWRRRLGSPVAGGSLPCGNINPSGITGTPVADPVRRRLYVAAFLAGPRHELFALDLDTGAVRWRRPIDPPGADPAVHQERAALALAGGRVYVAYGGLYGDCGPYHGWVVGAPAAGPGGPLIAYRVPTAREGGIWAPPGPALDAAGDLYVATGNGSSTTSFDHGNAVIRLSPGLRAMSYFAPRNGPSLAATDTDLGSTSPVLLGRRRAFVIGKDGVGYLLDTQHLGGIGHPLAARRVCGAGAYGADAYAHGTIYVPCADGVTAVRVTGNRLRTAWRQRAADQTPVVAGPGVWAIGGSTLYQLDPRSGRVRFRAPVGTPAHFASPAAAGGRVVVAAGGRVQAFR